MQIDGVFEGGGVRGIALAGAAAGAMDSGYEFHRVAGTSAGALERTWRGLLADKGVTTYADLPDGALQIVATDITHQRGVVLPPQQENSFASL